MKEITDIDNQSWLDKISELLMREPKDKSQLMKLLRDAEQRKIFNKDALSMLEGVLSVSEVTVKKIMIKRKEMVSISLDESNDSVLTKLVDSKHSRIPCFNTNFEDIAGILHAKDVLPFLIGNDKTFNIKDILRPVSFVPENKRLDVLLKDFRNSRNHMAIILDEYASVIGLVTIEDVLEQIVGDIIDEFESA